MRSLSGAVLAGLVLVLAYPPTGWAVLAIPAVMLFLWAVRQAASNRVAWASGFAFGVVFFGFLFPWLAELGIIALLPLVVVQAAFPAVYAAALHRVRDRPAWRWFTAAVGGWALMELVRIRFPVGGFSWGLLGHVVGELPAARNAARWIGASGWSVVLVAVAAGLVLLAVDRGRPWMAAPLAVAVALSIGGLLLPPVASGEEVRVAIVQGNSPCPGLRCAGERAAIYRTHLELTRTLRPGTVDLVVWPEGSTGFSVDPILDPTVAAEMGAEAQRLGAHLLAGGDRPVSDTEWINANVMFDPDGEIVGEYRKRHPVPFGEYVPARPLFSWIPDLSRVPRDMIRGDGPVVFATDVGPIGSVISFESSFARYARDTVRAGADLLVVATSQASYPYSNASDQLIGITRMRSAELGVDVVHGAVTGRSALITDGGVVGERTPLAEAAIVTGVVQMRDAGPTLYTVLGDWVQVVAALSAVGMAASGVVRRGTGRRQPEKVSS